MSDSYESSGPPTCEMLTMASPCTPHRDASKRVLDPSPQFSNYFSDDETSPQASGILRPSPSQSKLLGRLNAIGRQILRKNPSDHEHIVLNTELDALEQTLNAPEPQSREPPDLVDSGLFIDDEPDEAADKRGDLEISIAAAEQRVKDEKQKRSELVERVNRLNIELKKRHEEIKHINDLTIQKLETSAQEILKCRAENHKLHGALEHSRSDLLFLKMQLRAIEAQAAPHIDSAEGADLKQGIEKWKAEWKAADMRLKAAIKDDDHLANGDVTSEDPTDASDLTSSSLNSPRLRKSRLTIIRPGLIAHHSADPFMVESTPEPKANGVARGGSAEPVLGVPEKKGVKSVEFEGDEEAEEEDGGSNETPWQELWDSLADFAGIYDP